MPEPLNSISPLDGRYRNSVKELSDYFSEHALIRYRLFVEIEYLIALGEEPSIKQLSKFSSQDQAKYRNIYKKFDIKDATEVKKYEKTINHDVKAIEYFLRDKLKNHIHPWIHFALTSEDINNLAYSLMWKDGLNEIYLPTLQSITKNLNVLAIKNRNIRTKINTILIIVCP